MEGPIPRNRCAEIPIPAQAAHASRGLLREEIRPRLIDGVDDEIGRGADAGEAAQVFVDDQPERPGERHVVGQDGDELRFRLGDEAGEDAQAGPRDGRLELGDQVGAFELRVDGADGAEIVQFRRVEQVVDVADELVLRQIGGVPDLGGRSPDRIGRRKASDDNP